jgi:hypothetical protein
VELFVFPEESAVEMVVLLAAFPVEEVKIRAVGATANAAAVLEQQLNSTMHLSNTWKTSLIRLQHHNRIFNEENTLGHIRSHSVLDEQ